MPGPVQATQTRYISLDTDFGYDALGGMGRLGRHSMEVLEPGTRQTDRIPGPPKTVGRWFAKLLDSLTPASSVAGWKTSAPRRAGYWAICAMPLPVRPTIPSAVRIWNRPCGSWPDCGRRRAP